MCSPTMIPPRPPSHLPPPVGQGRPRTGARGKPRSSPSKRPEGLSWAPGPPEPFVAPSLIPQLVRCALCIEYGEYLERQKGRSCVISGSIIGFGAGGPPGPGSRVEIFPAFPPRNSIFPTAPPRPSPPPREGGPRGAGTLRPRLNPSRAESPRLSAEALSARPPRLFLF